MNDLTHLHHDMLTMERRFEHAPQTVFDAFASAEANVAFMCPAPGAEVRCDPFDFRPGGRSVTHMDFGPQGQWRATDNYAAIDPAKLILMQSVLEGPDGFESATVITIRFSSEGAGCLLHMTEQGAYLSAETVEGQREGWNAIFDTLAGYLSDT